MDEARHTPGPWETVGATRVWKVGEEGGAICIVAEPICKHSGDFREVGISSAHWDKAMANARLIAAAPTMLKALVACVGELNDALGGVGTLPDDHPGRVAYIDAINAIMVAETGQAAIRIATEGSDSAG